MHYDAYPHEHFGSYKATIKEISRSITTDKEEENPISVGEPYYKVTAALEVKELNQHALKLRLQQGMTLRAVIVGAKRKLWQWLFKPLF